jgi:hypothetical protein
VSRGRSSRLGVARRAALVGSLLAAVWLAGGCGTDSTGDTAATTPATTPATTEPDPEPEEPRTGDAATTVPDTTEADTTAPGTVEPRTVESGSGVTAEMSADDIPVAFTPTGGWTEMPTPVLAGCTEPLVPAAPDMRGTWQVVSVDVDGTDDPAHPALGEIQRIEQCGDRVVITAGGIIHDMRADGTEERGVNDVAAVDKTTPITVVATFENGAHVLRPVGVPIEVTRLIDGDQLVWGYLGFTARLDRISDS